MSETEDRLYGLMEVVERQQAAVQAALEKARLQTEVAELKANYDGWVKAGVQEKVIRCNPGNRPCIRVNESAGPFESQGHNDYRVIQGY